MELIHECEPMQSEAQQRLGTYEWACVTCGRRVRFTSNPASMQVLVLGDPMVQHVGMAGVPGLRVSNISLDGYNPPREE